jgi:hypothetical protein
MADRVCFTEAEIRQEIAESCTRSMLMESAEWREYAEEVAIASRELPWLSRARNERAAESERRIGEAIEMLKSGTRPGVHALEAIFDAGASPSRELVAELLDAYGEWGKAYVSRRSLTNA